MATTAVNLSFSTVHALPCLAMPDSAEFFRLAERSIEVEWAQGGVTPVAKPHTTGWRVLPFLVTAQLVGGRSLIELDGSEHALNDGQCLCIRAGVRHRITLQTTEPAHSLWSHVYLRLFASVDVMRLFETPVIITGDPAEHIGKLNTELVRLHALTEPTLLDVVARRRFHFELLHTITATAQLAPRSLHTLQELQRLTPVLDFIEQNLDGEPLDLPQLARRIGLSPSRFSSVFRQAVGQAPSHYIQARRMDRAAALLISTSLHIQDIAERAGFGDPFHFSRLFSKQHGMSPRAYREKARIASL